MLYVSTDVKVKRTVLWMWTMLRSEAQIRVPTPENTWKLSTCVFQVRHPYLPTIVFIFNDCVDQDASWYGNRPRPRPHYIRWVPSFHPPKETNYHPILGPCLLWPNCWMDQDDTWYGGRHRPRRHCVRWPPISPPKKKGGRGTAAPIFLAHVYCRQTVVHLSNCRALFLKMSFLVKNNNTTLADASIELTKHRWRQCSTSLSWFVVHSDVDECAMNRGGCDINAYCFSSLGSACCVCMSGYYGNGFNCSGNVVLFYVEQ